MHCRTGSLGSRISDIYNMPVHCRTGSLETLFQVLSSENARALPYRQFRNGLPRHGRLHVMNCRSVAGLYSARSVTIV